MKSFDFTRLLEDTNQPRLEHTSIRQVLNWALHKCWRKRYIGEYTVSQGQVVLFVLPDRIKWTFPSGEVVFEPSLLHKFFKCLLIRGSNKVYPDRKHYITINYDEQTCTLYNGYNDCELTTVAFAEVELVHELLLDTVDYLSIHKLCSKPEYNFEQIYSIPWDRLASCETMVEFHMLLNEYC